MSNKDTNVATSQAAANTVIAAEIAAAAINGNAELHRYWANWGGLNVSNHLYKNA